MWRGLGGDKGQRKWVMGNTNGWVKVRLGYLKKIGIGGIGGMVFWTIPYTLDP